MQKIKNEKGITMAILVVTIIVLLVLLGATLDIGLNSLKETRSKRLELELEMVQQATISEYTKAKQLGYTSEPTVRPPNFVGTKVEVANLPKNISWQISEEPAEEYKAYYELDPGELEKLEILNSEFTYIANYFTGEVYNKTRRATPMRELLYITATSNVHREKEPDNESFNDWIDETIENESIENETVE